MRVRLKGINSITKKLADGTRRTYWYAWKGGPPLRGEPGTPEFVASYNEAAARKTTGPQGTILSLLQGYQQSTDFLDRRERTKTDYKQKIKQIEERFGDFPLAALSDRRTRGLFMAGMPLVRSVEGILRTDIEMFSHGGLAVLDANERSGYDT